MDIGVRGALWGVLLAALPLMTQEAIALEHPHLALTADQIERARSRMVSEPWAAQLSEEIVEEAEDTLGAELPVFERDWWRDGAKDADWGAIYPEVNLHTGSVPRPPATDAWNLALAYALTGRPDLGREAVRILEHFADTYTFEIEHYDVGLNTATWGIPLLHTLDVVWPLVPEDSRQALRGWFLEMGEHVLAHDKEWVAHGWGGAFNNHYAWHKRLLAELGLFYGRPEWVEYAIRSPMGVADLLENGLRDGGLWLESSSNYHFTTLYALAPMAQVMRNAGHPFDLFTHRFKGGATLEQLFTGPLKIARPDRTLVPVGDCYGRTVSLPRVFLYEMGYAAYRSPELGWVVAEGRKRGLGGHVGLTRLLYGADEVTSRPPDPESQVLREHGWALLRGRDAHGRYWDSGALALFATWDVFGIHANHDALSFQLFGKGRPLLIDAEATASGHAFSSDVQRELNRHTVCHNTVMVDQSNQRPNRELLTLDMVDLTPGAQTVVVSDPDGILYEGVRQRRQVTLAEDGITDRFELESGEEHTYDYLLHYPAGSTVQTNVPMEPVEMDWAPAARWIRNARHGEATGAVEATIDVGGVALGLTVAAEPGTEVLVADFPSSADHRAEPSRMIVIRRRTSSTVFESVHRMP